MIGVPPTRAQASFVLRLRQTAAAFSVECQRAHSLKAALSSLPENKIHLAPGKRGMGHMFRNLFGQQGNAELE